jgi:hypothetical protein
MKPSPSKGAKAGAGAGKKRSSNEAEGSAQGSTPPTSPPRPNPNKEWKKSKTKTEDLLVLVNSGFLREKEMDMWRVLGNSGKPVTLETSSLTKFLRYVFQGQGIYDFQESWTCKTSGS